MLAPVTHILPLTTIRRERLLPAPGRLLIRKGQKVAAADPVAELDLQPEHMLLDIARGLGLPPEKADRQLQYAVGEPVSEGSVIAGPVGFSKRVVRAPKAGRILAAGEGQVLLQVESPPFELKAGLPGSVVELLGERGVVVETTGALVQGVWGNGRVDSGLLNVLLTAPDEALTSDRLDVSQRGAVVLAGHCSDAQALKTAAELPVRGLILASLDPGLARLAARMEFPLILLEGFGNRPMNTLAYRLLTTNERREAAVNAEAWDPYRGARPEVVIPLPASAELPIAGDVVSFNPGQTVRVLRAPYSGMTGSLAALRDEPARLPNGLTAPAAEVRLENGELALVPLANLEVLA